MDLLLVIWVFSVNKMGHYSSFGDSYKNQNNSAKDMTGYGLCVWGFDSRQVSLPHHIQIFSAALPGSYQMYTRNIFPVIKDNVTLITLAFT